jgi:hypothetical protein
MLRVPKDFIDILKTEQRESESTLYSTLKRILYENDLTTIQRLSISIPKTIKIGDSVNITKPKRGRPFSQNHSSYNKMIRVPFDFIEWLSSKII